MSHATTSLFALLLLAAAACAEVGDADDGSAEDGTVEEALAGGCRSGGPSCPVTPGTMPVVLILSDWWSSGISYQVAPGPNTQYHDHYLVHWGILGEPWESATRIPASGPAAGVFTLANPEPGATYYLYAQECDGAPFSEVCGPSNPPQNVFTRPPGTTWEDTSQWRWDLTWLPFVPAGYEGSGPTYHNLGVCSAQLFGGQHIGKWMGWGCLVAWGGVEYAVDGSMVLTTLEGQTLWRPWPGGGQPPGMLAAGRENGQPQYICRAWFSGGEHPGKWLWDGCHFSWGGTEHVERNWAEVLTRR